jgi:hypothetical protein
MTFPEEARMLCGFGVDRKGQRVAIKPLLYTGKKVPMWKEYEEEVNKALKRVRSSAEWC